MSQRQRDRLILWAGSLGLATCVVVLLCAAWAAAASLKVCYKDVKPDTAAIPLYVGGIKAVNDLMVGGASQPDGSSCTTLTPVPAAVARGTSQNYTLKATNAAGEEGGASNVIALRFPNLPGPPVLVSVGADVP